MDGVTKLDNNINNTLNDQKEKKILHKLYSTSITYISIFIMILFVLMNYYVNNPKGTNYTMFDFSELMNICLNPEMAEIDDISYPCNINDFIKDYSTTKTPEDLDFFEYSMYILRGAYILCSTYNETIINKLGAGVYNLATITDNKPTHWAKHIALYTILYLIIFYLSQHIKSGVVQYYFNKFFKKRFTNILVQSVLSILMLVFTLLLFINLGSYITYLFTGALSSNSNKLMYVIMLILIPFVFWIAGVKMTIEGFREGAKGKKDNKGGKSSKSESKSKCVKVTNYDYVIPLMLVFIIPVIVTLKTFFTLLFTGLYGIPAVFVATDSDDIQSKIKYTMLYSLGALIISYIFTFCVKIIEIVNK